jgi:hypothetical protein
MNLSRLFFAIVAAFALWVGAWSFFDPSLVVNAIPWPAPPLHARFIGALNLSAAVVCAGAALSRSRDSNRHVPIFIAVWTGLICVASFLHLPFSLYGSPPVWVWIFAYVTFPLVAFFLVFWDAKSELPLATQPLPSWQKTYLGIQGIVLVLLGGVLFVAPALAAAVWPWALNETLAQVYAGPMLAYGAVSLLASRGGYTQARLPMLGALVFAILVLIASVLHRAVFSAQAVSTWVWFAGFAIAAVSLAMLLVSSPRHRRAV